MPLSEAGIDSRFSINDTKSDIKNYNLYAEGIEEMDNNNKI